MVNLALAKVPVECIDYVVLHELLHLVDALHGERFIEWLDALLQDWQDWQERRCQLNAQPLADLAERL